VANQGRRVILKNIGWLWATSAAVCEGRGFSVATRRIRFLIRALAVFDSVEPMINASPEAPLGQLMRYRPETVGAVTWPYQCLGWDARTRLARICEHYSVIEEIAGPTDFPAHGRLLLLDLKEISKDLKVILDQPVWFMREGQLTINLFLGETRMYSLSFSLFHQEHEIATFVGAIQGRDIEGARDQYRDLTKASHGMRPRDLLIEVFRMLCSNLGIAHIYAVSDAYRQHRDPYYGRASTRQFSVNYDQIWADRDGVLVDPMFFRLDVDWRERDPTTIAANKRAMYRRRYEMLGRVRQQMRDNYRRLADASSL
jgi:uncharacterized protein VirK/YbjX